MTEEEAAEKWCPFALIGVSAGSTFNRALIPNGNGFNRETTRCIGSACMAWRWEYADYSEAGGDYEKTNSGHCGLAGKP